MHEDADEPDEVSPDEVSPDEVSPDDDLPDDDRAWWLWNLGGLVALPVAVMLDAVAAKWWLRIFHRNPDRLPFAGALVLLYLSMTLLVSAVVWTAVLRVPARRERRRRRRALGSALVTALAVGNLLSCLFAVTAPGSSPSP
jgi:uncharacterized BrkB/YihY/UPF0761 family membrane protein